MNHEDDVRLEKIWARTKWTDGKVVCLADRPKYYSDWWQTYGPQFGHEDFNYLLTLVRKLRADDKAFKEALAVSHGLIPPPEEAT